MKSKYLFLLVSIIIISCQRKKEKSFWDDFYKVPYVISEKNHFILKRLDSLSKATGDDLIYPPTYLGSDTFGRDYMHINILLKNGVYFIHKVTLLDNCIVEEPKPISFINLTPSSLLEIAQNAIIDTLKTYPEKMRSFAFASLSDTISTPFLTSLIDSIQTQIPFFIVRRITEEEHHVLDAKTRNIPYDPKNYKWVMNYGRPIP